MKNLFFPEIPAQSLAAAFTDLIKIFLRQLIIQGFIELNGSQLLCVMHGMHVFEPSEGHAQDQLLNIPEGIAALCEDAVFVGKILIILIIMDCVMNVVLNMNKLLIIM